MYNILDTSTMGFLSIHWKYRTFEYEKIRHEVVTNIFVITHVYLMHLSRVTQRRHAW